MTEAPQEYITDALEMMGILEPKQIVTEVSGFIPVFEVVLSHYDDHVTALVFGRMWQYCRMSDGVCRATIDRLADDLKISGATVMRHIEKLEEGGYIYDNTPDRRNRPHEYVDCGKVIMKGSLSAIAQKNVRVAQKNVRVAQKNVAIAESQLIKQDNTTNKDIAANAAKPDLLDAEIHFNLKPTSIREAIKTHFRLNVNWDTKLARQWMEWAVGENVTAEQIEAAAQLWRSDKAFNWQVPTLKGIFEKWPMLNTSVKLPQPKTYDPAAEVEPEYVPAPPRKK